MLQIQGFHCNSFKKQCAKASKKKLTQIIDVFHHIISYLMFNEFELKINLNIEN